MEVAKLAFETEHMLTLELQHTASAKSLPLVKSHIQRVQDITKTDAEIGNYTKDIATDKASYFD